MSELNNSVIVGNRITSSKAQDDSIEEDSSTMIVYNTFEPSDKQDHE